MNPAPVLLSSFLATLRSGFCTKLSIFAFIIFSCNYCFAQTDSTSRIDQDTTTFYTIGRNVRTVAEARQYTEKMKGRKWFIGAVHAVGYGGTLLILNNTWYKGYAKTDFHTFNDSKEWLQMDKIGHAWGAYNASLVSAAMWKWAGVPPKKAALIGALGSTLFLTGIELMDAHSAKWGWSWSDMAANIAGAGLFVGQEYLWNEQRIQFKFSFHMNDYSDPQLEQRADDLFGENWYERMLKDYNAQTYWLSFNMRSFLPKSKFPPWLNISVGYGADGMYGGFENKWTDPSGNEINRSDIPRVRQFYLAPDIDFTKIKTKSKFLKTAFTFLNAFKCPAPALMLDSKGKFKAYLLYF